MSSHRRHRAIRSAAEESIRPGGPRVADDDTRRRICEGLRAGGAGVAAVPDPANPGALVGALVRDAWDAAGRYRIVERPGVAPAAAPFPVDALIERARWFSARLVDALASLGEDVRLQYVELRIETFDAPPPDLHYDRNYLTATCTVYGGDEGSALYRAGGALARTPAGTWLVFNGLHRRRFAWYRTGRRADHPAIAHMRGHGRRVVLVARWEPAGRWYRWWRRWEVAVAAPLRRIVTRAAHGPARWTRRLPAR